MAKLSVQFKLGLFFAGIYFGCLNLSHAQTTSASGTEVYNPPTPTPAPSQPAPQPVAVPAPPPPVQINITPNPAATPATAPAAVPTSSTGAPVSNALNPVPIGATPLPVATDSTVNVDGLLTATPGKYSEYQSICRTHEFDGLLYQPDDFVKKYKETLKKEVDEVLSSTDKGVPPKAFAVLHKLIQIEDMQQAQKIVSFLKNKPLKDEAIPLTNAFAALIRYNYTEARIAFNQALNSDPKNEFILTNLAEVFMKLKNYYEASTIYEDLNKKTQNKYLAELCESTVLNALNAEGEKICMEAAKKFRDNPFPLIYAGISNRERQDNRKATAYFRLSLKVKPTEMGNICLAEIALIEKKLDEAEAAFKLSVQQSPKSVRAILGLAAAQMSSHQYDEALETYRKACNLNRRYEVELRKAYKKLTEEKSPVAEKFMRTAQTCGT